MPRIYSAESDPIDFCRRHFPSKKAAEAKYGQGEGPDERGNCFDYNSDHPPYGWEDVEYTCEVCDKPLTSKDD